MKFKANRKDGICDAMRCKEAAEHVLENGTKLCAKHFRKLEKEQAHQGKPPEAGVPNLQEKQDMIEPLHNQATQLIEGLPNFEVDSIELCEYLAQLSEQHNNFAKMLDEERKKITQPMIESKRKIDALFNPAIKANREVVALIKAKIVAFHNQQEAQREAAVAQAVENPAAMALVDQAQTQPPSNMHFRSYVDFEVVDVSLVPREFMSVDRDKVQLMINEHGENTQIPGLRFFVKKTAAFGG